MAEGYIKDERDEKFINGEIGEVEYLQSCGIYHESFHAGINLDGEVEIWYGKNKTPPWRRTKKEQRFLPKYITWRSLVFERDGYTCQECGKVGVTLNAHHKKHYAYFPKLRFDVDNGVTLCKNCHKKRHKVRVGAVMDA